MKRFCRQHGIPRWPSRQINKVNRSLSKLKRVIESVQGVDGSFSLTLSPTSIPVGVGSISWPAGLNGASEQPSPTSKPTALTDERDEPTNHDFQSQASSHEDRNSFTRSFKASGSHEASAGTSASHGSCRGSPVTESTVPNGNLSFIQSLQEQAVLQPNGDMSLSSAAFLKPFGSTLAEDASSSKDLRNLCSSATDANVEVGMVDPGSAKPPFSCNSKMLSRVGSGEEMRSVTMKANFREDIIRFRFGLSSNIVDLRDEVTKRFKIDVGTFEIKYLDDDNEWVLIACDSDLQECMDIMRSSGNSMIRLSIHDMSGKPWKFVRELRWMRSDGEEEDLCFSSTLYDG